MYLYTEYSVYTYMEYVATGRLINKCIYDLIIK
jgi:hypothetical protein